MGANNDPNILGIPLELIGMIASHLSTLEDFRNYRLTCRRLNDGSLPEFGNRFFRHQSVNLHDDDLKKLVGIAEHPYLRGKVEQLDITPQLFHDEDSTRIMNQSFYSQAEAENLHRLIKLIDRRNQIDRQIRSSGDAQSRLTHAMERLKNVSVVRFHPCVEDQRRKLWSAVQSRGSARRRYGPTLVRFSWDSIRNTQRDANIVLNALVNGGINCSVFHFSHGLLPVLEDMNSTVLGFTREKLKNSLKNLTRFSLTIFQEHELDVVNMALFLRDIPKTLEELYIIPHIDYFPRRFSRVEVIFEECLTSFRCQNLRTLRVRIPGRAVPPLCKLIHSNRGTLKSIATGTLDLESMLDRRLRTTKWSDLLQACLEVERLEHLALTVCSNLHVVSKDYPKVFVRLVDEDELDCSPGNSGRVRLYKILREWQVIESAIVF